MDDSKKVKIKPKNEDENLESEIKKKGDLIRAEMTPGNTSQQRYITRITARILMLSENIAALPPKLNEACPIQTSDLIKAAAVLHKALHGRILVKE